jgi:hypothetical protein
MRLNIILLILDKKSKSSKHILYIKIKHKLNQYIEWQTYFQAHINIIHNILIEINLGLTLVNLNLTLLI